MLCTEESSHANVQKDHGGVRRRRVLFEWSVHDEAAQAQGERPRVIRTVLGAWSDSTSARSVCDPSGPEEESDDEEDIRLLGNDVQFGDFMDHIDVSNWDGLECSEDENSGDDSDSFFG